MRENKIMVSVICAAYNHENFIEDCLNGILTQKTDFKYELIIHDDASTDRTAEIIKKYEKRYSQIVKPIYQKENQFYRCNISKEFLYPQIKGKYIAFCDGDDYWIDKEKLQKQVDFLESHEEYSMCMHNAIKRNFETKEEILLDTFPEDGTYSQEMQILAGLGSDFPAFSSVMVRTSLLEGIPDFFFESKVMDYPIRQYFANKGNVYYFKKPMSVYRASTPQSYMKQTFESQDFYNDYTLEMIRFFENFNKYTEGRFRHILEQKIISDYFGFCLSVEKKKGLQVAIQNGLDILKVQKCYERLSIQKLHEGVKEVSRNTTYLFIYGTSRIAPVCKRQLEYAGIDFEGFVVSDNQMKVDFLEEKKVFHLSEVIANYDNPGFVLAIQPVNVEAVAQCLKDYNVSNYCMPYML